MAAPPTQLRPLEVAVRCAAAAFAAVLGLAWPALARAEGKHEVAWVYERLPGAEACSGGEELRQAVVARLGYDPFVTRIEVDRVLVRIEPDRQGLKGSLERRAADHTVRAKPTVIASQGSACTELEAALAVAIAIAIDPLSLTREPVPDAALAPVPAPAPPAAPPTQAAIVPPQPDPEPADEPPDELAPLPDASSTPTIFYLAAGPALGMGSLPEVSWGVRLLGGFSYDVFELDVEGRFDPPVSVSAAGGSIEASLLLGTVAPCVRYGWVVACAALSFGALRGSGLGFDHERTENTLQSFVGTRTALDVPLGRHVSVRLGLETQFPLVTTELVAGGERVWSTPAFALAGSVLVSSRFP